MVLHAHTALEIGSLVTRQPVHTAAASHQAPIAGHPNISLNRTGFCGGLAYSLPTSARSACRAAEGSSNSSAGVSVRWLWRQWLCRYTQPEVASSTSSTLRQIIESINQTLKAQLGLPRHGARTPAGVAARVLQRLLALTAAIWHNQTRPHPIPARLRRAGPPPESSPSAARGDPRSPMRDASSLFPGNLWHARSCARPTPCRRQQALPRVTKVDGGEPLSPPRSSTPRPENAVPVQVEGAACDVRAMCGGGEARTTEEG